MNVLGTILSASLTGMCVAGCAATASKSTNAPEAELTLGLPAEAPGLKCAAVTSGSQSLVGLGRAFLDEFDDLDLDKQRWLPHYDGGWDAINKRWLGYDWGAAKRTLPGNKEQQLYVDPLYKGAGIKPQGLNPFAVRDGVLEITARRMPAEARQVMHGFEFYSGLLTSRASLVQTYGYFEMRAKIPSGKALWPAFWLLPADKSWPPEIDIVEVVGQQADLIVTTTHAVGPTGARASSGCRTRFPESTTGFNRYGVLWTPERIVWYINRKPVTQMATPQGVDKPMYMLLNLAVGGNMVGKADDETPLPAVFAVDWVAAWALPAGAASKP